MKSRKRINRFPFGKFQHLPGRQSDARNASQLSRFSVTARRDLHGHACALRWKAVLSHARATGGGWNSGRQKVKGSSAETLSQQFNTTTNGH